MIDQDGNGEEVLNAPESWWKEMNIKRELWMLIQAAMKAEDYAITEEISALAETEAYALSLAEAQAEQAQTVIEAVEVAAERLKRRPTRRQPSYLHT